MAPGGARTKTKPALRTGGAHSALKSGKPERPSFVSAHAPAKDPLWLCGYARLHEFPVSFAEPLGLVRPLA